MKKLLLIILLSLICIPASILALVYKEVGRVVGKKPPVTYSKFDDKGIFLIRCKEDASGAIVTCTYGYGDSWIDFNHIEFTKLKWEYEKQPAWQQKLKAPKHP